MCAYVLQHLSKPRLYVVTQLLLVDEQLGNADSEYEYLHDRQAIDSRDVGEVIGSVVLVQSNNAATATINGNTSLYPSLFPLSHSLSHYISLSFSIFGNWLA